jgi:hypothetical protein
MPTAKIPTRGQDLVRRLRDGRRRAEGSLKPGARDLPVLSGVSPNCLFARPMENVLVDAGQILVESQQVFSYGDGIYQEVCERRCRSLMPLARGGEIEHSASSQVSNLMVCSQAAREGGVLQFAPPQRLLALVFGRAPFRQQLPVIRTYATRPVFDRDYHLLAPGWHPGPGVLVHGPAIDPILPPEPDPGLSIRDRLPPHLRTLLNGFCFREAADAANFVAALLTVLLVNLFVQVGKPVFLVDGNQPGLGKSLLARLLGILLDGVDPFLIHFTEDDEELSKRICATLRGWNQSLLWFDNAKVRDGEKVNSRVIEANSLASQISLRILGMSENYTRPNDVIWTLTMNETKVSADLASRGVPIRLHFDGNPDVRDFGDFDPLAFAQEHRVELLGELAGMVVRWNQRGRPEGTRRHRCGQWARVVGGIVVAAGFPEFLTNLDDAAASFNHHLDELAALAEAAVAAGLAVIAETEDPEQASWPEATAGADQGRGRVPGQWEECFRKAGVQVDTLDGAKSKKSRETSIGRFLGRNLEREVPIEVDGQPGRARLRCVDAGRRQRRYFFEILLKQAEPAIGRISTPAEPLSSPEALVYPISEVRRQPPAVSPPTPFEAEARAARVEGMLPGRAGNDEDW